jgi:N-acetylneuraminic acid mutarotase
MDQTQGCPFNQSSVSAFAEANGKIYLAGGTASTYQFVSVDKVQEYDPEMDSWSIKAEIPIDVFEYAFVGIDENIFVVGGRAFVPGGRNKVLWQLDLIADTWTALDTLSFNTMLPAAVALAGKIYCIGGADSLQTVQVYDRLMNKWEIGSPIKYPVQRQLAVVIKGKIYTVSQDWKIQVFTP